MKITYKLYILIRNDLPSLTPGRKMAHAAHAANQFVFEHKNRKDVKKWQLDANGFGTTICLSVNRDELKETINKAKCLEHPSGLVYDPEYGYVLHKEIADLISRSTFTAPAIEKENDQWCLFRHELTCGYLFIEDSHPDKESLVGSLPLHP